MNVAIHFNDFRTEIVSDVIEVREGYGYDIRIICRNSDDEGNGEHRIPYDEISSIEIRT